MTDADPSEEAEPIPPRQEIVQFYGDAVVAVVAPDGTIYVPMRPLCTHLGLTWPSQSRRLSDDASFAPYVTTVEVDTGGGPQAMTALPLSILPGWLGKLHPTRLRPALQAKIIRYQQECFMVLWEHFKREIVPAAPPPGNLSGAALAVENARAILHLAEQQLALEQRYTTMADYMRDFVKDTRGRLTALELQISSGATVTPAQAAEIMLAVKAVASLLPEKSGANGHQQVYSALYRKFRISAYKSLPAAQYAECMAWLHGWYLELGGTPPAE